MPLNRTLRKLTGQVKQTLAVVHPRNQTKGCALGNRRSAVYDHETVAVMEQFRDVLIPASSGIPQPIADFTSVEGVGDKSIN